MDYTRTWVGLAHVKPRAGNVLLGDCSGAFVPVVALADSDTEFASAVAVILNAHEFDVLSVEDIELFEKRLQHSKVENEVVELAANLTLEDPIAFSDFEAYECE